MRLRRWSGPGPAEDGSATLEAVIIAPIIITLITFAVVLGRIANFHESVEQAVQAAARAGASSRDATKAENAANATWTNSVTEIAGSGIPTNGIHCTGAKGAPDAAGFTPTAGTPGSIAVNDAATAARTMFAFTGTCTLETGWLFGVFSQDITVKFTAYSPLDPYRCRTAPC